MTPIPIDENILVPIEKRYENSKLARKLAKDQLEAARGQYRTELMARREAGQGFTVQDMNALMASAINKEGEIKTRYLEWVKAETEYRLAKLCWNSGKREWLDQRQSRFTA